MKDYPQVSVRLPAEVRAKLQALSIISARPQWRLIAEAIECFLQQRPAAERKIVEELIGGSRRNKKSRAPR